MTDTHNCKKGFPCKGGCISRDKKCDHELEQGVRGPMNKVVELLKGRVTNLPPKDPDKVNEIIEERDYLRKQLESKNRLGEIKPNIEERIAISKEYEGPKALKKLDDIEQTIKQDKHLSEEDKTRLLINVEGERASLLAKSIAG